MAVSTDMSSICRTVRGSEVGIMDGVYYDEKGNLLAIVPDEPKPGDINEDGLEIEQDGDVTRHLQS